MTGVMIIDTEEARKKGGLNSIMRSQYVRERGLICFSCRRGLGRYIVRRQGASRAWYYCVPCAARLLLIEANPVNEKENPPPALSMRGSASLSLPVSI